MRNKGIPYVPQIVCKCGDTGGHGLAAGVLRAATAASAVARRACGFWYVVGVKFERVLGCGDQLSIRTGVCRGTINVVFLFLSFQSKVLPEVVVPALGFVGGGYPRVPHA